MVHTLYAGLEPILRCHLIGSDLVIWDTWCHIIHLTISPLPKDIIRHKKSISEGELAAMTIFPRYGAWKARRELIEMAASLEELGNETADGFEKVNVEVAGHSTMTMQKRI